MEEQCCLSMSFGCQTQSTPWVNACSSWYYLLSFSSLDGRIWLKCAFASAAWTKVLQSYFCPQTCVVPQLIAIIIMQRGWLWTHVKYIFENAQWKQSLQTYILWFNQKSQYWNMGVLLVLRLIISLFPRVAQNFCPSFAWWAFAFQVNIVHCFLFD